MSVKSVISGVALFAVGVGAGYGVGYYLAKKRIEGYIDQEIQSVKDMYSMNRKEGVFSTPEGAVEALISEDEQVAIITEQAGEILQRAGYTLEDESDDALATSFENGLEPVDEPEEPEHENVWEKHGNDVADEDLPQAGEETFTEEEEESQTPEDEMIFPRDPDHPYIISEWQFMHDGEHEDNKESLLYFEGDETLVDDRETIIPNVEYLVGLANLHTFGKGSRSKDTLYVRNEKTQADYEIIRDTRNFTEVVLGIKPAKSGPLRMRNDDQ